MYVLSLWTYRAKFTAHQPQDILFPRKRMKKCFNIPLQQKFPPLSLLEPWSQLGTLRKLGVGWKWSISRRNDQLLSRRGGQQEGVFSERERRVPNLSKVKSITRNQGPECRNTMVKFCNFSRYVCALKSATIIPLVFHFALFCIILFCSGPFLWGHTEWESYGDAALSRKRKLRAGKRAPEFQQRKVEVVIGQM